MFDYILYIKKYKPDIWLDLQGNKKVQKIMKKFESVDESFGLIGRAFELAYGRSPTDAELALGLEYLSIEKAPDDKLTRWESYAQVILGSNELIYID